MKPTGAYVVATWFGCGLSPIAPGTVGTLGALPVYIAFSSGGPIAVLAVAAFLTAVGIWAAGHVSRHSGIEDPQIVVVDEVAGVLVTLAAAPVTFSGVAMGILLFRFFDIVKPWPVRAAERLPGGWGIMADDIVAGIAGAAILVGLRRWGVLS